MFKSEKGNTYVNWVIAIIVLLFLVGLTIRVLVGDSGLINQKKEEMTRKESEKNIVIELTNNVE